MGGVFISKKSKMEGFSMANRKTFDEKLEAARLEKEQAEALIKKLLKEQKEAERKARNHRFCKRGGLMEKLLPDLAALTDEQFESFFKNTTASNYGRKALAEIVARNADKSATPQGGAAAGQEGGNAETVPAQPAARTSAAPAPKPTGTAQNGGANNNSKTPEAARVAG
jgi:hypothetical protein